MAESYEFLEAADNGLVNSTAHMDGEASPERIADNRYGPEAVTEHGEVEHDVTYNDLGEATNVDEVKIDRDLGIVDVFKGEELAERYSFLGAIEGQNDSEAYFGKDFDQNTEVLRQEGKEVSNWGPELAAAYRAIDRDLDITGSDLKDRETVSLAEPEEDDHDFKMDDYSEADMRSDIKQIDRALGRLNDSTVADIEDFEEKGVANIDGKDHPFSSSRGNGARGYHAARNFKHKFGKLNSAGIIDYEIDSLDENGSMDDVDLKIDDEFMSENGVKEDLDTISDADSVEKLVEERCEW